MLHRWMMAGLLGMAGLVAAGEAAAQPIGTFSWQLQPFCNVVTVSVTQNGGVYTLDGFDNQCEAAQRAPLVGLATQNPDGTIGLGLSIVTVPGGLAVHVDARLTFPTLGGSWSDSAGNSGSFTFNGPGNGTPRPAPTIPAVAIAPGGIGAAQLAPGAVGSAAVADGAIGAADVNSSQVQLQIAATCPSGEFMAGATPAGAPICQAWVVAGGTNTALGRQALQYNIGASNNNTAIGQAALQNNSTGSNNTAVGLAALRFATTGSQNVAVGASALGNLTTGPGNTGVGLAALSSVVVGGYNVGVGFSALSSATSSSNTAVGYLAGFRVTTGGNNALLGYGAGSEITTGVRNVAIGAAAGTVVTTGNDNIHIGNSGVSGDNATIRIGGQAVQLSTYIGGIRGQTPATASPHTVVIGSDGELGSVVSSRRFKEDIAEMGDASARLFTLRPVTFRYKQPMRDGSRPLDFGLIAEEVAESFPELATTDQDGVVDGVAYHKLPALLLNELQKQQRAIDALQTELADLKRLLTQTAPPR